jgi:hypothetical protein
MRVQWPLASKDFMLDVAMGRVPGVSYINKFGRNPDIDTATVPEDIWDGGGIWVPPTAARTHDIVSSSVEDVGTLLSTGSADTGSSTTTLYDAAADFVTDGVAAGDTVINDTNYDHSTVITVDDLNTLTLEVSYHSTDPAHTSIGFNSGDTYRVVNPSGTGASITHWFGLDSNMAPQEEFVIMNGQTNIATASTYYRIHRGHVDGAASRTVNNVGNITATAQTDATVTAQISAGNGQTQMVVYTVPAGKTGFLTHIYADLVKSKNSVCNLSMRITPLATVDGAGSRVRHPFGLENGSGHYHHSFRPYDKILANTDIWIRCDEVSANDMDISAGFGMLLVDT